MRIVVCGAGGFIGSHLVTDLKRKGHWVRGVDIKQPEFGESDADEFLQMDLRDPYCAAAAARDAAVVYQLAADMGGMGFIEDAECEIMHNSALININMLKAAVDAKVPRYFFTSSACVYPVQDCTPPADVSDFPDESVCYPAMTSNEYGWEKLYAERMALTFARRGHIDVRICRIQNCYGPLGTWQGGREKAPAALCRKVALADDGGEIEIWGPGTALRIYTYIDDLLTGIHALMASDITEPVTMGSQEVTSVLELAAAVADVAGKTVTLRHIDGPVGSPANYHSVTKLMSTGWAPTHTLHDGLMKTYPWIRDQALNA